MADLAERVQSILGPLPPGILRAFRAVAPEGFLPGHLGSLARADAPLPFFQGPAGPALRPSPRVLALWLQLLELDAGAPRVLVVGAESGFLGALAVEAGAKQVRIVEPDREVASAAEALVRAAGVGDRVEIAAGVPAKEAGTAPWDRILLLDPRRTLTAPLGERLSELGFAVQVAHTRQGHEVVKTLRSGGELVELRASGLRLGRGLPEGEGALVPPEERGTLTGLLTLEEMSLNVWRGAAPTRGEAGVRQGVEDTWKRPPAEDAALDPVHRGRRDLARKVFHLGYVHQAAGDLDNAADLYQRSLGVVPSAEAHTFLGWVRASQGRLEDALACCHRAIAEDPSLGNPYNDIGAYLVQLGRTEEAIPWLERALQASRYEAPFYPHLNLARIHMAKGRAEQAREHLRRVLELNPGYPPALELLRQLEERGPEGRGR